MKKVQTLALALALIGLGSVSRTATSISASRSMQKNPPETNATNLNSSRSNIYRVKVTMVTEKDRTFAVEVNFSAAKLKALPNVGEFIDTPFIQTTPGGPMATPDCCIRGSKSNTSDRVLFQQGRVDDTASPRVITGKVTRVNAKNNTFTVEVTFSGKNLNPLPEVGKFHDITFTGSTTPGGPPMAVTVKGSKSNSDN